MTMLCRERAAAEPNQSLANFGVANPLAPRLILLHGTTEDAYAEMMKSGVVNGPVYLTDCPESARYYGRMKAIYSSSYSCILEIEVESSDLQWDWDSYFDPIPVVVRKHNLHSKQAMQAWWERMDRELDLVKTYVESLSVVNATFSTHSIPASAIRAMHPSRHYN